MAEVPEDDDLECRHCRLPTEPGNPLRSPCRCRGSVQYVHESCLDDFFRHRPQALKRCELCLTPYVYGDLWAEDRPDTLPWVARLRVLYRILRGLRRSLLQNAMVLALVVVFNAVMWEDSNLVAFGVNNAWQYFIVAGAVFVAWRIYDRVAFFIMEYTLPFLHRLNFEFLLFTIYSYLFFSLLPPLIGLNSCMLVIATLFIPWIALSFCYATRGNVNTVLFFVAIPYLIRTDLVLAFKTIMCPFILGVTGRVLFGTRVSNEHFLGNRACILTSSIDLIHHLDLVRKGAFWWLIRSDIDDNLGVNPRQIIVVYYAFHAIVVFVTLHVPLKIIATLFPDQLRFDHQTLPFGFTAGYLLLVGAECFNFIGKAISPFVHRWIVTFSGLLKLNSYFLRTQEDPDLEEINMHGFDSIGYGSLISLYYGAGPREEDNYDSRFLAKSVVMGLIAAGTLCLTSVVVGSVLIMGDIAFFHLVSFVLENLGLQLQNCFVAYWIVCLLLPLRRQVRSLVVNWKHHLLFFSIWVSVVPALLGRLIGTPRMFLLHRLIGILAWFQGNHPWIEEWFVGLLVLTGWSFMCVFTQVDWFQTQLWITKIEIMKEHGIEELPMAWLFDNVIASAIETIGFSLLVPYLLSLFLGQIVWPACFIVTACCFFGLPLVPFVNDMFAAEYRRLYLLGENLLFDFVD